MEVINANLTLNALKTKGVHHTVRIEASDNSVGRSYSCTAKGNNIVPGLGAARRALRTKSFDPYGTDKASSPTLESMTMQWTNLNTASREQFLAYFRNTWGLTDVLFSVSYAALARQRWP